MPLDRMALRRRLEQGIEGADSFDATKTMNTYAKGAWDSISEGLDEELMQLEGAQGNTGRFNTGFYDMERGDIYKSGLRNFGNQMSMRSFDAARMQMDADNEGYERTQSLYEHDENDYRDEQERKRRKRSGIGSALGGLIGGAGGFLVGGPVGAAAGAKIGAGVGGAF